MASTVYFTKDISPDGVLKLYRMLGVTLSGRVAVKLHSGEKGNQNFLGPDFWRPVIDFVGGTVVECNTAYEGERDTTERHRKLMTYHGWDRYFKVDILDAEGDMRLEIPSGRVIKENFVGKNLASYDSMLVLSHFKGHPMGGCGGALKQLSIGVASSMGKKYIHGAGSLENFWETERDLFLGSMADAALSVVDYIGRDKLAYVNVMKNMSVDCDCCAIAEDPCIADIGILASTDPVALDQACVDLVYACEDKGRPHLIERIESRNGIYTVEAAAELGIGSREYDLIEV